MWRMRVVGETSDYRPHKQFKQTREHQQNHYLIKYNLILLFNSRTKSLQSTIILPSPERKGVVLLIIWTTTKQSDSTMTVLFGHSLAQLNASFTDKASAKVGCMTSGKHLVLAERSWPSWSRTTKLIPVTPWDSNIAASLWSSLHFVAASPRKSHHLLKLEVVKVLHITYFELSTIVKDSPKP